MTIRERFIELLLKTNADMETYKSGIHKGDFKNPVIRKMWLAYHTAWQESREELQIKLPQSRLSSYTATDEERGRDYAYNEALNDCAKAIRTEGLKVKGG
ncbi:TPA: hypothetical protein ACHOYS_001964 [Klebsiella quasipneumoniae subsp. similipneumoniae]